MTNPMTLRQNSRLQLPGNRLKYLSQPGRIGQAVLFLEGAEKLFDDRLGRPSIATTKQVKMVERVV